MNSAIPLSGGDRIKIVVFFLVLAGTIFFGVIPILIALTGIYIMKKDKSFSPIIKSRKYIKAYLVVLALGTTTMVTMIFYSENTTHFTQAEYDQAIKYVQEKKDDQALTRDEEIMKIRSSINIYNFKENFNPDVKVHTLMIAGAGLILIPVTVSLLMSIFGFLYFKPLEKHKEWVINNGIFADLKENDNLVGIIGRDKLSSFSVADELIKWNDLLEKKLISQEEFNEAKQKILNQKL